MDKNDFIREIKNLIDRFFAEWISLNKEYEKSIAKDLEELKKETVKYYKSLTKEEIKENSEWAGFSIKQFEKIRKREEEME